MAASTHPGEDEQVLEAYTLLRADFGNLICVLAPRHPPRATAICELFLAQGFRVTRSSELDSGGAAEHLDVLVVDQMGILMPLYADCDVAFVGGSLIPRGGHNPIEPASVRVPVITGPHNFNFTEVHQQLAAAGALCVVTDAPTLATEVGAILKDATRQQLMGAAGYDVVATNRGATDRTLAIIDEQLALLDG